MRFGDRSSFAVEVTSIEQVRGIYFGTVSLIIDGIEIGDEVVAPIFPFWQALKVFIERRVGTTFLSPYEDCQTLFDNIVANYFDIDTDDITEFHESYEQFVLCPGGGEFFDGWRVFVVRGHKTSRVIFQDIHKETHCCFITWDDMCAVAKDFSDWFVALMEKSN